MPVPVREQARGQQVLDVIHVGAKRPKAGRQRLAGVVEQCRMVVCSPRASKLLLQLGVARL
jgi:hypothetical protein